MPCALTIRWLGSNDFHLLHPVRSAALTCLKTKNEKCREVQGFPPSCPSVEELRPRPNESKPEYVWPKPMRRQSMVPVDFKIVRGRCGEPTYFVAPAQHIVDAAPPTTPCCRTCISQCSAAGRAASGLPTTAAASSTSTLPTAVLHRKRRILEKLAGRTG